MTFAQRRNRLTTHFSEHITVVKRRMTVLIGRRWPGNFKIQFAAAKCLYVAGCNVRDRVMEAVAVHLDATWYKKSPSPSLPTTLCRKGVKELQNRLRHLCGQFHYYKNNWRLLSAVRNIWCHCSSFLEGSEHPSECFLYGGHCCLWFERLIRLCASPVSSASSPWFISSPWGTANMTGFFTVFYSVHQQMKSLGIEISLRGVKRSIHSQLKGAILLCDIITDGRTE
jgi:hypothetical protein